MRSNKIGFNEFTPTIQSDFNGDFIVGSHGEYVFSSPEWHLLVIDIFGEEFNKRWWLHNCKAMRWWEKALRLIPSIGLCLNNDAHCYRTFRGNLRCYFCYKKVPKQLQILTEIEIANYRSKKGEG